MKYRAHNLTIKTVCPQEEYDFLVANHYQGYVRSIVAYGLYDKDKLLEVMTFGRPRFNCQYGWELLRLCTLKDCNVYGGASKLFNYFIENSDISKGIISYCNRDKFDGNVYKILGFKSMRVTKGYHYEKDGKTYHRANFTKQNCLKRWPKYKGKTISEREIMQLEGYTRVEDKIGQELFVYNDPAKYYLYKLTFEDGATYIGQHIQYRDNDNYVTSSFYAKTHKIVNKEIMLEVHDKFTLNLVETLAIMQDKCNSVKNVNGNLGNFVFSHPYNINYARNYKWSESTRAKMKIIMTGHKVSEETRKKISAANKGRHHTEEARRKMSEALKGKPSWMKGKHHTEEAKAKLRAYKGWHHTEEAKRKISERSKGRDLSKYTKGTCWWNNGLINKRSKDCPGDGFVKGRLITYNL